jgi:hypothetical protein
MEPIEIVIRNNYGDGRVCVHVDSDGSHKPVRLEVEAGADASAPHTSFYTAAEARLVADALLKAADGADRPDA